MNKDKPKMIKVYNLKESEVKKLDQIAIKISRAEDRIVTRSKLIAEHIRKTLLGGKNE
jgi:hypothetical protein